MLNGNKPILVIKTVSEPPDPDKVYSFWRKTYIIRTFAAVAFFATAYAGKALVIDDADFGIPIGLAALICYVLFVALIPANLYVWIETDPPRSSYEYEPEAVSPDKIVVFRGTIEIDGKERTLNGPIAFFRAVVPVGGQRGEIVRETWEAVQLDTDDD